MRPLPWLLAVALIGCPPALDDDDTGDDDTGDDDTGDDDTGDDDTGDDDTGDDDTEPSDDDTGDDDTGDDDTEPSDDDTEPSDDDTGDDDTGDDDSATELPGPDASLESCAGLSDATALAAVYGNAVVPAGWFADSYPGNEWPQWGAACSNSLADTQTRAGAISGTPNGATRTTPRFFEVSVADGAYVRHYRETRCDWYDGSDLAGAPFIDPAPLADLAGYEWYRQYFNLGGARLLGAEWLISIEGQALELCTTQTVYGDWGLCDEITLRGQVWSVSTAGAVSHAGETVHRTIQGNCN